ncbi:uncharacterized protein [Ptychodera flava]|uniref:uncharacterized protein isoform X1 n=3 Tax=Ptychodera flava TaxID=63121 RepID=UPI003969C7F9
MLFTQLDNCYRENKNRYMLSLAHVLVQYKVFDMVDLHFLPVGHTHEDIDQLFSCISRHLKKTNIYTMDDMERAVMNSYNVPVFVKHVEGVFDIKKWLLPHMVKNFKGQSKPLHFQFKEFDGKVRMRYRHRSTSNWRPVLQFKDDDFTPIEESKGLICLKTLPNVDDVPEWVKPSIEKMDPERLRKDLPDAYQGRITCERDKQWLREFAQNINDHAKAPSSRPQRWFLHDLIDAAKQRRDRQQNTSMPDHILSIQQNIENECPDVVIGRPIPTSEDRGNSLEKMDDFSSLKEGMLVAVYLPDVKRQPQIGKVVCLKTEEEVLTLHWYTGSWKAAWKPTYRGVGRNRRPNTQIIWIQASIMWDFSLTPSGMLPKQTRTQLHERYREIEDESDQEQS